MYIIAHTRVILTRVRYIIILDEKKKSFFFSFKQYYNTLFDPLVYDKRGINILNVSDYSVESSYYMTW